MAAQQELLSLDLLNQKQKIKEFKSTAKDLKSKDDLLKFNTLKKVSTDLRYFSEGGCIIPLFNCFVPKKKAYQTLVDIFPVVIQILMTIQEKPIEENELIVGLSSALQDSGTSLFSSLKDCICLKEPVKKSKTKGKKRDEALETDPPENALVLLIRELSIKLLYYFIIPLRPYGISSYISKQLRSFLELTSAVCNNVVFNIENFHRPESSASSKLQFTQNLMYGLQSLVFLMRDNPSSCALVASHSIATHLSFLIKTKQLAIYALQIYRSLSTVEVGVQVVVLPQNLELLLTIAETIVQKVKELTIVVEIPTGKSKDAKKDDKSKKDHQLNVAADEKDPLDGLDSVKIDVKRDCVVCLTLFSSTFIEIVKTQSTVLSTDHINRVFGILHGYLLSETVWEVCCSPLSPPVDEPVDRVLEYSCWLLGSLSEVSYAVRLQLCQRGALELILNLLLNSSKIFRFSSDVSTRGKLLSLRRYVEKTAFSLLLSAETSPARSGDPQECRWFAIYQYSMTEEMFSSFGLNVLNIISDLLTNVEDVDLCSRASRILAAISLPLKLSDNLLALTQTQLEKTLTAKLCSLAQHMGSSVLAVACTLVEENEVSGLHNLDPLLIEGLYLTLTNIEIFLQFGADHIKILAEKSRIELFGNLIDSLGPTLKTNVNVQECSVFIYNVREYDWHMAPKSSLNAEFQFARPLIIDVLTSIVVADMKYRTFEGTFPVGPGKSLPTTASPCEDCSLNVIKTCSDIILKLFIQTVNWTTTDEKVIKLSIHRELIPIDLVRISALQYLTAVGKCGPIGLAGILDSVAAVVFSGNSGKSSLSTLLDFISSSETIGAIEASQLSWKRPEFFNDIFAGQTEAISTSFTRLQILSKSSTIWPFIAISTAIQSVMMDPSSNAKCSVFSLEAASALMQSGQFEDSNQSALSDILIAVFLSVGGGFSLIGLTGSFGSILPEDKEKFASFVGYVLSRGKSREQFWKDYYNRTKEPVNIDPKTGKPIPKKEDKKKDAKEAKKDPKAPIKVPVITELTFNFDSTEEFNDPNRGPTTAQWKELLDFSSNNLYLYTNRSSLFINAIQSSLVHPACLLMDQEVDINFQDDYGRTALMYAFILENETIVQRLLSCVNLIDINLRDNDGNATIFYALCSVLQNINQVNIIQLFQGFCGNSTPYLSDPICVYGNARFLPVLLQQSRAYSREYQLDLSVNSKDGVSPILFALGIGNVIVNIGGYSLKIKNQAYYDINYLKQKAANSSSSLLVELSPDVHVTVESLLLSGAKVNQCSAIGLVPLHIALAYGDHRLVELCFQHHAEANAIDYFGRHGLHYLFAACPPVFSSLFQFFVERCLFKPIIQIPFNNSCRKELSLNRADDYHRSQGDNLLDHVQRNLREIFWPPVNLFQPKRIKKLELLLFCKDFCYQLTPLDYCFLQEHLTQIRSPEDDFLTEIIQFTNTYRHFHAKLHRVDSIIETLQWIKQEPILPEMIQFFPLLKKWQFESTSITRDDLDQSENHSCWWLLKHAQRIINDNIDINNSINGYNIQNNLNLLFYALVHEDSSSSKAPLEKYNINTIDNAINLAIDSRSKAVNIDSLNVIQMLALLLWKGKTIEKVTVEKGSSNLRNISYPSSELRLMDILFMLITLNQFYYPSVSGIEDMDHSFIFAPSSFLVAELGNRRWTAIHLAIISNNTDFFTMLYQQSFAIDSYIKKTVKESSSELFELWESSSNLAITSPFCSLRDFPNSIVPASSPLSLPKSPKSSPNKKNKKAGISASNKTGNIVSSPAKIEISSQVSPHIKSLWKDLRLIHYIASIPANGQNQSRLIDRSMCSRVLAIYLQEDYREDWRQLLNEPSSTEYDWIVSSYSQDSESSGLDYVPLHQAILKGQYYLIEVLSACRQVDMNRKDPITGFTPLHQLCIFLFNQYSEDFETIQRYFRAISAGKDRVDLTILAKCPVFAANNTNEGMETTDALFKFMTCVEYVIFVQHSTILNFLIELRRNDVIEVVLNTTNKTSSLLYQLEEEHYCLLVKLQLIPSERNEQVDMIKETAVIDVIAEEEEEGARNNYEEEKNDELDQFNEQLEEIELKDEEGSSSPQIDQSNVASLPESPIAVAPTLSEVERIEYTRRLQQIHSVLKILLELINPLGLLESSSHYNELYCQSNVIDSLFR